MKTYIEKKSNYCELNQDGWNLENGLDFTSRTPRILLVCADSETMPCGFIHLK